MNSELTGLQSPVAREWMLTKLCFPMGPSGVGLLLEQFSVCLDLPVGYLKEEE